MSSTTVVLISSKLFMRYKICMTGTGKTALFLIIRTAGILVFKEYHDGNTGSFSVEHTTFNDRNIIFLTWCSTFLGTTLPPLHIGQKILNRNVQSRRATINYHPHTIPMRFAEYLYPK